MFFFISISFNDLINIASFYVSTRTLAELSSSIAIGFVIFKEWSHIAFVVSLLLGLLDKLVVSLYFSYSVSYLKVSQLP
jgi:hypothetical protein